MMRWPGDTFLGREYRFLGREYHLSANFQAACGGFGKWDAYYQKWYRRYTHRWENYALTQALNRWIMEDCDE